MCACASGIYIGIEKKDGEKERKSCAMGRIMCTSCTHYLVVVSKHLCRDESLYVCYERAKINQNLHFLRAFARVFLFSDRGIGLIPETLCLKVRDKDRSANCAWVFLLSDCIIWYSCSDTTLTVRNTDTIWYLPTK